MPDMAVRSLFFDDCCNLLDSSRLAAISRPRSPSGFSVAKLHAETPFVKYPKFMKIQPVVLSVRITGILRFEYHAV